ncbi:hypothetical protein F2Q70_00044038 [Brassica cretica]|uniref:Uncharacterized protein n=1 Tax=Brassica cretica TaxID=69181 RepID=A0A8S9KKB6_BRACR|nr:hypothetical protein F2Q70_00044038 [Brassica cretica]
MTNRENGEEFSNLSEICRNFRTKIDHRQILDLVLLFKPKFLKPPRLISLHCHYATPSTAVTSHSTATVTASFISYIGTIAHYTGNRVPYTGTVALYASTVALYAGTVALAS